MATLMAGHHQYCSKENKMTVLLVIWTQDSGCIRLQGILVVFSSALVVEKAVARRSGGLNVGVG